MNHHQQQLLTEDIDSAVLCYINDCFSRGFCFGSVDRVSLHRPNVIALYINGKKQPHAFYRIDLRSLTYHWQD